MQLRLLDPGPLDFSSERARDWFDDQWWGKTVLVWTEDGILYGTAPYRGVWRGFGPGFGGLHGVLDQGTGLSTYIGPAGIVEVREHDPLAVAEEGLVKLLEAV